MIKKTIIKVKKDVDLKDLCQLWIEREKEYTLESEFDEFISINKETRILTEYGYGMLVMQLYQRGVLEFEAV